MATCSECEAEVTDDQAFCDECGAELTNEGGSARKEDFMNRYGAEPLPFAEGRSELMTLYGKLLGSIPVFGSITKLFVSISFWWYGICLQILRTVTGGADVTKRFSSDYEYLKDSFYSGYDGESEPPSPPA